MRDFIRTAILTVAIMLSLLVVPVHAQNLQTFPRIRMTFTGSASVPTLEANGWWVFHTSGATPPVSAAGDAHLYFNGTNWLISENGGAFHVMGPSLPTSVFTSTGAFQTQTANTLFAGPTSGGAAVPTFRAMVANDITAGIVSFSHWASNSCTANQIPKRNAGNTAWVCAADDTSVGGTAWVTGGNTLGAGTAKIGSLDAFGYNFVANNSSWMTVSGSGNPTIHSQFISDFTSTSLHAFSTSSTSGGSSFGYYKFGQRAAPVSGDSAFPGGSESVIYMDSSDSRLYVKEGTNSPTRISGQGGGTSLSMPTGFNVAGSGSSSITVTYGVHTWVQWRAAEALQPTSSFANFDIRNDHTVLEFTDGNSDAALFEGVMPDEYDGNTFDVTIRWAAVSATTGNVRWECSVERNDSATDIDADSFGTTVAVTTAVLGTAGFVQQTSCTMNTSGTRDSLAAGETFRIKVRRLGADAADTATGSMHVLNVRMRT